MLEIRRARDLATSFVFNEQYMPASVLY